MVERYVMQVDEEDRPIGPLEIIKAHTDISLVHRGLTFGLKDVNDNFLLQRRSRDKYTFRLQWDLGGSTHAYYNDISGKYESDEDAIRRSIKNELGLDPSLIGQITYNGKFRYDGRDPFSSYIESEWDWVYDVVTDCAISEITVNPDKNEVEEIRVVPFNEAHLYMEALSPLAPWTSKAFQVYKKATKIK